MEDSNRYLLWGKVIGEYRGIARYIDVHAIEATPGNLRVAEASSSWNFAMNALFLVLIGGPPLLVIIALSMQNPGTVSAPITLLGAALVISVVLVDGVFVVIAMYNPRGRLGQFMLAGAFKHSRKVCSLEIVGIEHMRFPKSLSLRCRADGQDLTVQVFARRDNVRSALELAGQPSDLLP